MCGLPPRFGANSQLNFHSARLTTDGPPSMMHNNYMYHTYPKDIRDWIDLPYTGFWTLRAPELWKMGYRRCE